jgi:phosphate transport system substrate-binding protein
VFLDHFALPPPRVKPDTAFSSEQAIEAVANHTGAIAYVCLGRAEKASATRPIRLLPLRGVAATVAEVRSGQYPLTRPLQLVTRGRAEGLVEQFLDFAGSEAVADLIEKHGFAPAAPQKQGR